MTDIKENIPAEEELQPFTIADVAPKLDRPWIFYPHIRKLNLLLVGALLSQVVCGYDGSMMNGLQSLHTWQEYFGFPDGAILGTMNNGMAIGTLITIPFVTFIVDYIGRRWCIIIGSIVIVVGAVLQGAATNLGMFVGGRILLGVGGCISLTASPPLVTECAYPSQRPVVTALLMPSWPLGAVTAAFVTWGPYYSPIKNNNWGWRIPSLIQLFFPLLQVFIAYFGPESPRWLIDKGRDEEARNFFIKYHANGDANHPIVKFEMSEIAAAIEEEKLQHVGSWKKWFESKTMFHRFILCLTIPMMQQLSGNALISYYLSKILTNLGITSEIEQLKINLGLNIWTLASSIFGAYIVGKFFRRTLFLTGYSSMFVVYVIWTALSAVNQQKNFEVKGYAIGVVFFIFVYQFCYQICSPIAFTYTMEICPYTMRTKGSMMYQFSGNIIGFFNNYVNPIAMDAITWKYYIVWCVWLVVQFTFVYFCFPETFGKDLEDVAEAFGDTSLVGRVVLEKQRAAFADAKDDEIVHSESV